MHGERLRRGRRPALALMVGLAVAHAGCGDTNGPDPAETFVNSRSVPAQDAFGVAFTAQRNGAVDAAVDWTTAANNVDVYATAGDCAGIAAVLAGGCNVIASSESETAKPEAITFSAANGTTYRVWAYNRGPATDTLTIRLTTH